MSTQNLLTPGGLTPRLLDFNLAYPRLHPDWGAPAALVTDLRELVASAREYGQKYVDPVAVELDRRLGEDHDYFAWDLVRAALPYRFFSVAIPKPFGGRGGVITHMALLMEELCAHDAGVANIFGAHGLGISPIFCLPDVRHFPTYLREIADAEQTGEPVIWALAHTEPGAGSDVEDAFEVGRAHLGTTAKEVPGGWRINGTKVFISNGSVARYIWTSAFIDKQHPLETTLTCVVPNDAPGFEVTRVEHKLGQRACPAAQLTYDDVFVPHEAVVGTPEMSERMISMVLAASRPPVAAIATGTARGAFERTLNYLNHKRVNGRWLFEEQWVQLRLADMLAALQSARALYLDAAQATDAFGIPRLMRTPSMRLLDYYPDSIMQSALVTRLMQTNIMFRRMVRQTERLISADDLAYIAGLASIAKFTCSDLAMKICGWAMEILGEDAPDPQWGVEKCLRDAKLTQIYEGTNQINRINVFDNLLAWPKLYRD